MAALYACTKCNQRFPFETLSQGQQLCKECRIAHPMVKCTYCRTEFQQESFSPDLALDSPGTDHFVIITQLKEVLHQRDQLILDKEKKITELGAEFQHQESQMRTKINQMEKTQRPGRAPTGLEQVMKQVAALSKGKKPAMTSP